MADRSQPSPPEGLIADASPAEAGIRQALETGLRLHQQGRLDEATRVYRGILRRYPEHPNALHLLGVIAHQRSDHARAIELITKAIGVTGTNPVFHGNLAEAYRALGRLDEAIAACRRALEIHPVYPAALNTMGAALSARGQLDEAEAALKQAIEFKPNLAEAHANLGNLYRAQGKMAAAVDRYERALAGQPNNAALLNNLAGAMALVGRKEDAVTHFRRLLRVAPDYPAGHLNLGFTLMKMGRYKEAAASLGQAIRLVEASTGPKPDLTAAHFQLGEAFRGLDKTDEAEASYRRAIDLKPDHSEAHANRGLMLENQRRVEDALASYDAALKLKPDHPEAVAGKARILDIQGRTQDAFACLQPLVRRGTDNINLAAAFAALAPYGDRREEAAALLERLLGRDDLAKDNRRLLLFKLGTLCDEAGDYDRAFRCFQAAHAEDAPSFDAQAHNRYVSAMLESFDKDRLARLPRARNWSELPVFIVGMPRSGTTLVEQILASHPAVFGAGELKDMDELVAALPAELGVEESYPSCVGAMTREWVDGTAERHLSRLEALGSGARRVTDKMPENFVYLGLISRLFPSARVIHCARHPLDTCLSCYTHHFTKGHRYAAGLESLAAFYADYRRLMRHWWETLDIAILDVRYEELVDRQEHVSRQIVAFCGIAWDDRCLRFHETDRVVWSASRSQVRKPIYRSSVGRWRHYKQHLGPLIEALGEEAYEANPTGS